MTDFKLSGLNSFDVVKLNDNASKSNTPVLSNTPSKTDSIFTNVNEDAVDVETVSGGNLFGAEALSQVMNETEKKSEKISVEAPVQNPEPDIQDLKGKAEKLHRIFKNSLNSKNDSLILKNQANDIEGYNDWAQGVLDSTKVSREDIMDIIGHMEYIIKNNKNKTSKAIIERKDTGTRALLEKLYAKLNQPEKTEEPPKTEPAVEVKTEPAKMEKVEAEVLDNVVTQPKTEKAEDKPVETPKVETPVLEKVEAEVLENVVTPPKTEKTEDKPVDTTKTKPAEREWEKVELDELDDIELYSQTKPAADVKPAEREWEKVELDELDDIELYSQTKPAADVKPAEREWEKVELDELDDIELYSQAKPAADVKPAEREWEKVELDELDDVVYPSPAKVETKHAEPKYEKVEPEVLDNAVTPPTTGKTEKAEDKPVETPKVETPILEKVEPEVLDNVVTPPTTGKTEKAEDKPVETPKVETPALEKVEPEVLDKVVTPPTTGKTEKTEDKPVETPKVETPVVQKNVVPKEEVLDDINVKSNKILYGKGSLELIAEKARLNYYSGKWAEYKDVALQLGNIDEANSYQAQIDSARERIKVLDVQIAENAKSREEAAKSRMNLE